MYRLLVVDDEPLVRSYLKEHLHQLHPRWTVGGEAEDGQDALQLLEDGEAFDLVLTDIRMPVMDGLELARRVSELESAPRMAIVSGYDEFALAREAIRYGVEEYLLKPLVPDELADLLERTARALDRERAAVSAQRTLLALSEQSRAEVARNFLRAVVSDNDVEIKALYPLLFRLKVSLIEAEGAILLAAPSDGELLGRADSPDDPALLRYIVHQTATELAGEESGIVVFFDGEQRTAALVAGEDEADVRSRARDFYRRLATAVGEMTGLRLWGAVGPSELDVLQLGASYRHAHQALLGRLFADEPAFYEPEADGGGDAADDRLRRLERTAAAASAAADAGDAVGLSAALAEFVRLAGPLDPVRVMDAGLFLLGRAPGGRESGGRTAFERAAALLKDGAADAAASADAAVRLYRRLLQPPGAQEAGDKDEHRIVAAAKRYILDHFAEPISLALIADRTGVSPGYLSSLFHRVVQEPYSKFLTRIRMEHAARLLTARPPEKVYDVSEKVGYVSVKHFSYVFKQHYGVPPGEYQARALERDG